MIRDGTGRALPPVMMTLTIESHGRLATITTTDDEHRDIIAARVLIGMWARPSCRTGVCGAYRAARETLDTTLTLDGVPTWGTL